MKKTPVRLSREEFGGLNIKFPRSCGGGQIDLKDARISPRLHGPALLAALGAYLGRHEEEAPRSEKSAESLHDSTLGNPETIETLKATGAEYTPTRVRRGSDQWDRAKRRRPTLLD